MEVKNIILGVVIAVIFSMFLVYGTKLIYENPSYEDFCNDSYNYPREIFPDSCNMSAKLRMETNDCYNSKGFPRYDYDDNGCEKGIIICDFCQNDFEAADKEYTKNLFVISLIFGLAVIVISVLFIKIPSVSGGLMLGSLFFMIYGTAGYWRFMEDILRFVILGVTLFVLIWLAYYIARKKINFKIKNKKRKKK